MTESHYRLPNEMAAQLQVSPSTLRRWSNEFSDYLSGTVIHQQRADQVRERLRAFRIAIHLAVMNLRNRVIDEIQRQRFNQPSHVWIRRTNLKKVR